MCIIVGKYFPGTGWAGAKNRDRKYIPTLDFIESDNHGIGRMMMHDLVTGYKEGIRSEEHTSELQVTATSRMPSSA